MQDILDDTVWDTRTGRWVDVATYDPFIWDTSLEGWTLKQINKRYWALENEYTIDDVVQECRCKFLAIKAKYKIENQEHGMSLYMRSVSNLLHDLAAKATKHGTTFSCRQMFAAEGVGSDCIYDQVPDTHQYMEEVEFLHALAKTSDEFKLILANADWNTCETRRLRKHRVRNANDDLPERETTNQLLCRLAQVNHLQYDLHSELLQVTS